MAERPHIAYFIITLIPGGTERRCLLLANEAARRGHEVTLFTSREPGILAEQLDPAVRLVSLLPGHLGRRLIRLRRELARLKPDVFQGFLSGTMYGVAVARSAGVPVIIASYGTPLEDVVPAWTRRPTRWCFRFADHGTVNSSRQFASYVERWGYPPDHLTMIPNFVPAADFPVRDERLRAEARSELDLPDEVTVFGTVASLIDYKNHLGVVEAAGRLAAEHPEARWLFVGDGPMREAIESRAAQLGLADRVRLTGRRTDVPRLLQACDAFILPSLFEGMPNAVLEAMATGLPVIGTAVSGTEELIEEGRTGWLIEPGSSDALETAMRQALARRGDWLEMGAAARRVIEERYDQPVVIQQYFDLYRRLLDGRRRT